MKKYFIITTTVFIFLFGLVSYISANDSFNFDIAYSNNVEGYLEPCG